MAAPPRSWALVGGKGLTRRFAIPPVDEVRPMLWKELHVERAAALGWFGRILGILMFLYLVVGSLSLAAMACWALWSAGEGPRFDDITTLMGRLYDSPSLLFSFLIQLTVGLRAAVTISSERERSTWDALLTSPLMGREIIVGKLWGGLYAMRWLLGGTLLAWCLSLVFGAMHWGDFVAILAFTLVASMYNAAVGVRTSLSTATATKAMSLTVGIWLGTLMLAWLVAWITVLVLVLLWLIGWMFASGMGLLDPAPDPRSPTYLASPVFWTLLRLDLLFSLTATIVSARPARGSTRSPAG